MEEKEDAAKSLNTNLTDADVIMQVDDVDTNTQVSKTQKRNEFVRSALVLLMQHNALVIDSADIPDITWQLGCKRFVII